MKSKEKDQLVYLYKTTVHLKNKSKKWKNNLGKIFHIAGKERGGTESVISHSESKGVVK